MRFITDISPDIVDLITREIEKGEYRTVQEFISTAILNQIYLIEQQNPAKLTQIQIMEKIPEKINDNHKNSENLLELTHYNFSPVPIDPNHYGTVLSGFWNKFLPVKITVRVLANLMNRKNDVLLDTLQEIASDEARKIGQILMKKEKGSGRKRGDRIFTGLPIQRNGENSKARFKSHFIGSLNGDKVDGMTGTLRFIDIFRREDGKIYVALTEKGLEFAKITNTILDDNDYSLVLSNIEKSYLISLIKTDLPEEFNEIKKILDIINRGNNNTSLILRELEKQKTGISENQRTIFLSGILNRLIDLNLLNREYRGMSYVYKISDNCKETLLENNKLEGK